MSLLLLMTISEDLKYALQDLVQMLNENQIGVTEVGDFIEDLCRWSEEHKLRSQ